MIAENELLRKQSPTPFLVRAMLFSTSGWERRRNVGKKRFVVRLTLLGVGTGAMLVTSTLFSAWRAGELPGGLLSGANLVLLVSGIMTPFVLFSVAALEWRLLEARYKLELAKVECPRSRIPVDPLSHPDRKV